MTGGQFIDDLMKNSAQIVCNAVKHPTAAMIWGCFSWYVLRRMYICEKLVNQTEDIRILETHDLPSIHDLTEEFGLESITFQDDSAPVH